jgi:WD40 repeat protein
MPMPKKSLIGLVVMLSMLLPLAAACGVNRSSSTTTGTAIPAGGKLYVLDGYSPQGTYPAGRHIVVFQPGSTGVDMMLPDGLTSLDHHLLVTAEAQGGHTTISIIDTRDGVTLRSLVLNSIYTTDGSEFNDAVLSYDGHWLALRQLTSPASTTTIALVDTQTGKLIKTIKLNGNFDLDAVSADSSGLYLLQRLNNGSGHYYVRLYNTQENEMYQYPIVDKEELNDPNMTGTAIARQSAANGAEVYTLYTDAYHNIAFVHVLPLDPSFPFAHCINLPVGKSPDLLRYYTLTLSADGSTLYVANGALGIVSEIHLNTQGTSNIYSDQIVATAHFNPAVGNLTQEEQARVLRNGAVLSLDQSTLYFAGVDGIWSVQTNQLGEQHPSFKHSLGGQTFTGVALSGQTLYAVDPAHGITMLDTTTGQTEQVIQGPVHTPWDIEWIDG